METEAGKRVSRERFGEACRENVTIEALCGLLNISKLDAYRLEHLYEIELPEKERPGNIRLG
jgi:hypothetical protein